MSSSSSSIVVQCCASVSFLNGLPYSNHLGPSSFDPYDIVSNVSIDLDICDGLLDLIEDRPSILAWVVDIRHHGPMEKFRVGAVEPFVSAR